PSLAERALDRRKKSGRPATPDMSAQQDQLVRIELGILRLDAELRGKEAQKGAAKDELAKIDELLADMSARPVFRAIEQSQSVAFVPYTQLSGVNRGAEVFECRVWGLFDCRRVGSVNALLDGEVAMQDPWGSMARGQYALMTLDDLSAVRQKT